MNSDMLYVIGNGFDLHHGIGSSYTAFGDYVKRTDVSLYETFEAYFSFKGNWASLEETLKDLDAYSLLEHASDFLVGYGSDKWRDSDNHAYQEEIARVVQALSKGLKGAFTRWVLTLKMPSRATYDRPLLSLHRNAKFLSFNYTRTLETLYDVPLSNVLHIHNRAESEDSDLILGHGVDPTTRQSLKARLDEDEDFRIREGNELLDRYFAITFKPTAKLLTQSKDFFDRLRGTRRIVVLGHSLSDVDLPYFRRIRDRVDDTVAEWTVTYHDPRDKACIEEALEGICVPSNRLKLVTIDKLAEA